MSDPAVARRMFEARQDFEKREGARLTLEELGRRIAEQDPGRAKPYAAGVVKRWIEGDAAPRSMETWRAIARVFGVRVGWLANGELPMRDDEGGQPATATAGPIIGPTVRRVLPKRVSRLDDEPERAKGKGGKRPPKGRTALAS